MSLIKFVLKYYRKMPLWALNAAAPLYHALPDSLRMGSVYKTEMAELERIDALSPEEVWEEQRNKLCEMVQYAYDHTVYYKNLFDSVGLKPSDIHGPEDLYQIPVTTKETMKENIDDMISDEFSKDQLVYITTSGSTGVPTGVYVQSDSHMRDWVYVFHMFKSLGYSSESSRLMLNGKDFQRSNQGKRWQWDAFKRELTINIFDLSDESMEAYCRAIEKYKPEFAYGYISAMYTLCKYIEKRGGIRHQFKGFIGTSEMIYPEYKEYVEKVTKAPVVSFYGMTERVVMAGMCPYSSEYHIEPLYGVLELMDRDGSVITEPEVPGRVVGTSLKNYGMPLIRYRIGDLASYSANESCRCGSYKKRLSRIDGRMKSDHLVGKAGTVVSMGALAVHLDLIDKVKRCQFYQDTPGFCIIKIVVNEDFTAKDRENLARSFHLRTDGAIDFKVEIVDELSPNPSGKFPMVDQKLELTEYL